MTVSNSKTPSTPLPEQGGFNERLDAIVRGLKAMYVDADAVSGEEVIYNFDEAKAAIRTLVLEEIGEDEPHIIIDTGVSTDRCDAYKTGNEADCNCPAGERNQLRAEQRKRLEDTHGTK